MNVYSVRLKQDNTCIHWSSRHGFAVDFWMEIEASVNVSLENTLKPT